MTCIIFHAVRCHSSCSSFMLPTSQLRSQCSVGQKLHHLVAKGPLVTIWFQSVRLPLPLFALLSGSKPMWSPRRRGGDGDVEKRRQLPVENGRGGGTRELMGRGRKGYHTPSKMLLTPTLTPSSNSSTIVLVSPTNSKDLCLSLVLTDPQAVGSSKHVC